LAEIAGEVEILFHQHDRHLAAAARQVDDAADILDDARLGPSGDVAIQGSPASIG
jgi:hypothetical protein